MGKQVTCVVLGAGQRGQNYASYSLDFPKEFKVFQYFQKREFIYVEAVYVNWYRLEINLCSCKL